MAGHSKWANIRHRKGAQDAKRGKVFTKLIREISVAAREGGPDEAANARLRDAVLKSLKANMKRDTIDNAIKRGAGGRFSPRSAQQAGRAWGKPNRFNQQGVFSAGIAAAAGGGSTTPLADSLTSLGYEFRQRYQCHRCSHSPLAIQD